tara:strand:+ start:162 stop:398 length:237 start_codon:yes stop_codon:yes gene_type:complete
VGKSEKEEVKTPININDKQYFVEDLTQEQQTIINHIRDLDQKVAGAKFNLDQLQVSHSAFVNMLTQQLEVEEAVDEEN